MKRLIVFQNKFSSIINIIGLSLSLTACVMIFIWIDSESHFDEFHNTPDKIYRVMSYGQKYMLNGFPVSPGRLGVLAKERIPEVELQTRLFETGECVFDRDNNIFISKEGIFADRDFFTIFNFPVLEGNPETWLDDPGSLILTESMSEKVFGSSHSMGESIKVNGKDFNITGILKDPPTNSHLKFEFVSSMENVSYISNHWGSFSFNTYFRLSDATNIDVIEDKLTAIATEHKCPQVIQDGVVFKLQPLNEIYLDTPVRAGFPYYRSGSRKLLNTFMGVALIILIMASINFVNLSLATSKTRSTEIGVKKTFGADRKQLSRQLVGESVVKILISICIAIILAIALRPLLEEVSGKVIEFRVTLLFLSYISGVILLTIFLSAIYPGYVISKMNPGLLFKGNDKSIGRVAFFNPRTILLFIQTVASVVLIFVSVFLVKQMFFIRNKQLGFSPEKVLCTPLRTGTSANYPLMAETLLKDPAVKYVSCSDYLWATVNDRCGGCIQWEGKDPDFNPEIRKAVVGFDYFNALDIKVVEGRGFSESYPSDAGYAFMINESAKKLIGVDNIIGLPMWQTGLNGIEQQGVIIGVFSDFNYKSLKEPVQPMVVRLMNNRMASESAAMMYVSTVGKDDGQVFRKLLSVWNDLNPGFEFECYQLDKVYNDQYIHERRNYLLLNIFTVVAVTISLLGLIGLIAFINERKTREICIRKVLGGSVSNILIKQINSVISIVIASIIVAIPVSLLVIRKMYEGYAYTTRISGCIYVIVSVLIIGLMATVVTVQSIKSAAINPAVGIKSE